MGVFLTQWNGKESNKDERTKSAEFMLATKVGGTSKQCHSRLKH